MEAIKFKTSLKCSGCVTTVAPYLNEAVGKDNWVVDLSNPTKILTVVGDKDAGKVIQAMEKAGYKAVKL